MGLIIEINGYKAVGKSTLIAGLRQRFPNAIFREGFRKIKNGLNQANEDEFYQNERAYMEREAREFEELIKSDKLVILLRGPEECLFYAQYAPKLKYGVEWDVETHLRDSISLISSYRADHILWLDADRDTLYDRKEHDETKPRLNMDSWNNIWNPHLGNFIKKLEYTEVLDTNNLSALEVLEWVVEWINIKWNEKNKKSVPERLYIETTNACNARCIMCPHPKMKRKIHTMDEATFSKVVRELAGIDLSRTTIFMHKEGEPLLDPLICERVAKIREYTNCKEIAINTNASLLDNNTARRLVESGIDTIYLSIDGVHKDTYESIRVGLNYDVVKRNVLGLFEILKSASREVKVILQMLTYKDNLEEVEEFKRFWGQYPCEIFIKRMHNYLDGGMSSVGGDLSMVQKRACTDPFNMLVVYSDGSVGACCWDYENTFNLGNIKTDAIMEIFNGEKIRKIREKHSKLQCADLPPCNRCTRAFADDSIGGVSGDKEILIK